MTLAQATDPARTPAARLADQVRRWEQIVAYYRRRGMTTYLKSAERSLELARRAAQAGAA